MADIVKKPVKLRDSKYSKRVVRKRQDALEQSALAAERNAKRRINKYNRSSKQHRYEQYLNLFEKIDPSRKNVVLSSSFWGNKKLRIDEKGRFVRERGVFRKTRKVLQRDAEFGAVVSTYEKESFRKKTTERYGDRKLLSKSVTRKDGLYEENWERSKGGKLIRPKYFTARARDGGLFRSISEDLTKVDADGYRTLTFENEGLSRKKQVFETDENGQIRDLIGRKSRTSSKDVTISKNRDFADVDTKHFAGLFSTSHSSRLDAKGNPISKDIGARRRFLSKRSLTHEDGRLINSKHTFGFSKLYKTNVDYDYTKGDGVKTVEKKLFGKIPLYTHTGSLTPPEIAANNLGKEEAQEHKAIWTAEVARREADREAAAKQAARTEAAIRAALGEAADTSAINVHPVPEPGTTLRLGTPPVSRSPLQRDQSPFASGVEFPTRPPLSIRQLQQRVQERPPLSAEQLEALREYLTHAANKHSVKITTDNPELNAHLAGWRPPVWDSEAAKTKPSGHQSSVQSKGTTPLAPENKGEASLRRLETPSPSKATAVSNSKSTNPEMDAVLAAFKPVGDNEAGKAKPPSHQSSVKSNSGSSLTLNAGNDELFISHVRSPTQASTSTLGGSNLDAHDRALLNSFVPVTADASRSSQRDNKGSQAAATRDFREREQTERRDREGMSLTDW
jgi:hypothetical protein